MKTLRKTAEDQVYFIIADLDPAYCEADTIKLTTLLQDHLVQPIQDTSGWVAKWFERTQPTIFSSAYHSITASCTCRRDFSTKAGNHLWIIARL